MPKQSTMRSVRSHPGATLSMTPWQESVHIFRNLKKRPSKKLQQQKRVLEGQSDEVEFFGKDGLSMFGGTIAKGFLFEYLADKPEPKATGNLFCILDEEDEFDFVPEEVGWDTNWSTQFAQ